MRNSYRAVTSRRSEFGLETTGRCSRRRLHILSIIGPITEKCGIPQLNRVAARLQNDGSLRTQSCARTAQPCRVFTHEILLASYTVPCA
jgi:hypothetical protein